MGITDRAGPTRPIGNNLITSQARDRLVGRAFKKTTTGDFGLQILFVLQLHKQRSTRILFRHTTIWDAVWSIYLYHKNSHMLYVAARAYTVYYQAIIFSTYKNMLSVRQPDFRIEDDAARWVPWPASQPANQSPFRTAGELNLLSPQTFVTRNKSIVGSQLCDQSLAKTVAQLLKIGLLYVSLPRWIITNRFIFRLGGSVCIVDKQIFFLFFPIFQMK